MGSARERSGGNAVFTSAMVVLGLVVMPAQDGAQGSAPPPAPLPPSQILADSPTPIAQTVEPGMPVDSSYAVGTVDSCSAGTCAGPCRCQNGWFCGGCNMPQHMAYYPSLHGYYYFRPHSVVQVRQQQDFVSGWGGDRRHPYANTIFRQVYAQLAAQDAAAIAPQDLPAPPPLGGSAQ